MSETAVVIEREEANSVVVENGSHVYQVLLYIRGHHHGYPWNPTMDGRDSYTIL